MNHFHVSSDEIGVFSDFIGNIECIVIQFTNEHGRGWDGY